jgi:hypothetical protein
MKYEEVVRRICGDTWKTESKEERDGGYGVACVLAFMRGVRPSLADLSSHLQVTTEEIAPAHLRLTRNGVFTSRFNAKRDSSLQMNLSQDESQRAWAHIAALSGGFIGV